MNARIANNMLGNLITVQQTCELSNLGRTTVLRLAKESGSMRKIGRCVRIEREEFFNYIKREYA